MDYFTWDCRFNDDFIYDCTKEKLLIVKAMREDSKMLRNLPEVRSVQSSMVETFEIRNFNQRS